MYNKSDYEKTLNKIKENIDNIVESETLESPSDFLKAMELYFYIAKEFFNLNN